jgi:AraC-like DNA-binding protein
MAMAAAVSTVCRPLFTQRSSAGITRRVETHRHPFWQLEIAATARIGAILPDTVLSLARGDGLLLPPGQDHAFRYADGRCAWLSIKFEGPAMGMARHLRREPWWPALRDAIDRASPASEALGHLLAALLAWTGAGRAGHDAGLVARLRTLCDHGRRPLSVAAAARGLGLTPGHASVRVRGESGLPLKTLLDRFRSEAAQERLRWSDHDLTHIAAELGFPDLFAFSRFFKRLNGVSPGVWRDGRRR